MTNEELMREAEARVNELCRQHCIRKPRLRFDLKGKAAGKAYPRTNEIRLNLILMDENFTDFIKTVIPHELCHLWKQQLGLPGGPHGENWQRLMRRMGIDEPQRCHQYDTSRAGVRKMRRFPYLCDCREYKMSATQHRRARQGTTYRCRKCKAPLKPKEEAVAQQT